MEVEDTTSLRDIVERARAHVRLPRAGARRSRHSTQRPPILKRGIALTPVKFGISLHAHASQPGRRAGACLPGRLGASQPRRHRDGAGALHQGRAGRGRGVRHRRSSACSITATTTDKVPNTSPTAASSGSDLNGMAAQHRGARDQGAAWRPSPPRATTFRGASVDVPRRPRLHRQREHRLRRSCEEGVPGARARCPRPASTRRRRSPGTGRKATGPAVLLFRLWRGLQRRSSIDTLTGEKRVTRVDILHDVGRSLNPAIDIGQIEGGFVQGMGWLTTEELVFDGEGRLLHPCALDLQDPGRVRRAGGFPRRACSTDANREDTIYRSKAVGEPPLMLAHLRVLRARGCGACAGAGRNPCRSTRRRRRKRF